MQAESQNCNTCSACNSEQIDRSIAEVDGVCESCGFVVEEGRGEVSLDWEILDGQFYRSKERKWVSECHIRNSTEKQLMQAIEVVEGIGDDLGLSNQLREEAVDVYCDAFRAGITDGRVTDCVVAVALCVASRRTDLPIPIGRLTQFDNVDETKYNSSHLALCDALDINPQIPSAQEYIPYIRRQLALTDDERESAVELLDAVSGKQLFVGKDPTGIAAAAIYLIEQECTQEEVAEVVGLSTETVRQRVQDLREVCDHV